MESTLNTFYVQFYSVKKLSVNVGKAGTHKLLQCTSNPCRAVKLYPNNSVDGDDTKFESLQGW